jgi:molybdenum cofactor cytidylyltransferase
MKISAIVVAAGCSSRFTGGNKLLAEIDGKSIARRVLHAVSASSVDEIVFVTPKNGAALVVAAGVGRWRAFANHNAESGLSSSIAMGLANISSDSAGAVIVLGDMPLVTAALLNNLCLSFLTSGGRAIVFPQSVAGRQGNPVLWPRALFSALSALSGDRGGKEILAAHPDMHLPVIVEGEAAFADVDTAADLTALRREAT